MHRFLYASLMDLKYTIGYQRASVARQCPGYWLADAGKRVSLFFFTDTLL
jgi:hypothetical protein